MLRHYKEKGEGECGASVAEKGRSSAAPLQGKAIRPQKRGERELVESKGIGREKCAWSSEK
jgi:hypothetical protein